jgi:hypothetical protein
MLKEELEELVNTDISDDNAVTTILSGLSRQYDIFDQCLIVNKKDLKLEDIISNLKCEQKRKQEKKQDKKQEVKASDTEKVFFRKEKIIKEILKRSFMK